MAGSTSSVAFWSFNILLLIVTFSPTLKSSCAFSLRAGFYCFNFQWKCHPRIAVGFRSALRPRTRLAQGLLRLGVPPEVLYRHLKFWRPEMTMRAVSRDSVLEAVEAKGGRLVLSSDPAIDPSGVHNLFCFITRD